MGQFYKIFAIDSRLKNQSLVLLSLLTNSKYKQLIDYDQ